jgi:hypothetical protein
VLDLFDEFARIVDELETRRIDYAVCGGLAMAIWAFPRATVDIDLLIHPDALAAVEEAIASLGYTFEARPMSFASGAVAIRRRTKIDRASGDTLTVDLLLVTPAIANVWETRVRVAWNRGEINVVSPEGLIAMKSMRNSGTDQDDIAKLRGERED